MNIKNIYIDNSMQRSLLLTFSKLIYKPYIIE